MKLTILENEKECVKRAADIICGEIRRKPSLVLGVATGGTMIPLYKELVLRYRRRKVNFSRVKVFGLDEFVGLDAKNKNSYAYYLNKNFFGKVNINKENIRLPEGDVREIKVECELLEVEIEKAGGIDLQLLGIGRNGHIGFNEPGSDFESRTREIKLTETTRKDDARFFKSKRNVPKEALTQGLATIMGAKKILLLAFGKNKARTIALAVERKPNKKVPAGILQIHADAEIIIDKEASSKLAHVHE